MLLDVMMPRRDGWELLRVMRQQPAEHPVRVIVCSIIDDPQMARALGADGFLRKPIDEQRLVQALEGVLAGR
jgi:CheY-like chemotaxis protein